MVQPLTSMPLSAPESLASHWDVLFYLLVVVMAAGLVEFRLYLRKLSLKQDELKDLHNKCQFSLKDHYITKHAYQAMLRERRAMWRDYFFPHTHFPTGEVRIDRELVKRTQFDVDTDNSDI